MIWSVLLQSKDRGHLIVANGGGRSAPVVETAWMWYTDCSRGGDKAIHGALPTRAAERIRRGRGPLVDMIDTS